VRACLHQKRAVIVCCFVCTWVGIYPSAKLREVIDVDPLLEATQCEALYKVVEWNQTTFGFDGCLRHLKLEVHIVLTPGTKPISMAPYYAPLAK
jgi:hypothetical protein